MPQLANPYSQLYYGYQPMSQAAYQPQQDLLNEQTRSYLGSHGLSPNAPLGASLQARNQTAFNAAKAQNDITNQLNYTKTMGSMFGQPGALTPTNTEMLTKGASALAAGIGQQAYPDIWGAAKRGAGSIWDMGKRATGFGQSTPTALSPYQNPYVGMPGTSGYGGGEEAASAMFPGVATGPTGLASAGQGVADTAGWFGGPTAQAAGTAAQNVPMWDVTSASNFPNYEDFWSNLLSQGGGGWGF
jgi:hypothetical protein